MMVNLHVLNIKSDFEFSENFLSVCMQATFVCTCKQEVPTECNNNVINVYVASSKTTTFVTNQERASSKLYKYMYTLVAHNRPFEEPCNMTINNW